MRRRGIAGALAFVATCLILLVVDAHLPVVAAQPADDADEPTCSLDPGVKGDCATAVASDEPIQAEDTTRALEDLTRQVVALTDDNFDALTSTSTPATWLIMFKTNSCAICTKARPVLEELSVDADIAGHNDRELEALARGEIKQTEPKGEKDDPKGPVYTYEKPTDNGGIHRGPVYVATIDAGWAGRDTKKRFGVDATPTILLIRNEGRTEESKEEARSYYVYRGQRATYPLRGFVLGGFAARKRMDVPPPLSEGERKPQTLWGRVYDTLVSPGAKWAGGITGKIVLAWFAFVSVLGLGMRVHNYAWGEEDEEAKEKALEEEKARGRREVDETTADEKSAARQKAMWERKAANKAKFAAKKEARNRKKGEDGEEEEMEGVGFSVKKSDAEGKKKSKQEQLARAKAWHDKRNASKEASKDD
ncbi:hypothetical protein ACHAXT_008326 [Thalassiosira profunda]